jgi:ABC-type uncharacterized transport system permease subunit
MIIKRSTIESLNPDRYVNHDVKKTSEGISLALEIIDHLSQRSVDVVSSMVALLLKYGPSSFIYCHDGFIARWFDADVANGHIYKRSKRFDIEYKDEAKLYKVALKKKFYTVRDFQLF